VAVTYSPLCDSVVVLRRELDGEVLRFGHSGLLYNSNPLLYDRRQAPALSSLWSQLQARAVAGPATGALLEVIPAAVATWQQWRERHPETLVLAPDARRARRYRRDPYHSYFGSDLLRFPVDPLPPDTGLRLKDRVVAVAVDGQTHVFAISRISEAAGAPTGVWDTQVGGVPIRLVFDRDVGAVMVEAGSDDESGINVRTAFWFAWYACSIDRSPSALEPGPAVRTTEPGGA